MEKTGFIYIWYDSRRKMFYIGCHWGTEDDGYICSSNRMRDAYRRRPHDFRRRIIKNNIDRNVLLEEEHKWLQLISDEELGEKYYNLSKKHFAHWSNDPSSLISTKQKLSETSKKLHQDPDYRERFLEGRKKMPPQTQEQIDKRAKSNTGKKRTEETKRKISESNTGKIMGPLSAETKQKLSEALRGEKNPFYGKQHDQELKKKMNEKTSQTMKGRKPKNLDMFVGSSWWNNGVINIRCKDSPGQEWIKGRKK